MDVPVIEVVGRILGVDDRAGKPENQSGSTKARDPAHQLPCDPADDHSLSPQVHRISPRLIDISNLGRFEYTLLEFCRG